MKRKTTLLGSLIVAMLLISGMSAISQTMNDYWSKAVADGWTLDGSSRGIGYGNGMIYIPDNSIPGVRVLDATTGVDKDTLSGANLEGGYFKICNVDVADDGSIIAVPLTLDASTSPLKVYRWADHESEAEVILTYEANRSLRMGDGFNFVGDPTGDAAVTIGTSSEATVFRFLYKDGALVDTQEIVVQGATAGTQPNAFSLGATDSSQFWYGNFGWGATLVNADGTTEGKIDGGVVASSSTEMKIFDYKDSTYMVVAQHGQYSLVNITGKEPADITAAEVRHVGTFPSNGNASYGVDYAIGEYGELYTFALSQGVGLYAYQSEEAPMAKDLLIAGYAMVDSLSQVSYTYIDVNDDLEGTSLFSWFVSDDKNGGNKTEVGTDDTYTPTAVQVGKYLSYSVLPVAQTGTAYDSVNLVESAPVYITSGEDYAPIVSMVMVEGTPEEGVVLNSTYKYEDYNMDPEGISTYQWYVADDANGTNQTAIAGATNRTHLVTSDQVGKHFMFEVTPVAASGTTTTGTAVVSDATVDAAISSTNDFGLERQWLASTKTGAAPFYLNPSVTTERGMAVGANSIYIASRYNGTKVLVINKADGSLVRELSTTGIEGGIYPINDVEVSDDGQILAAPLAASGEFWIYKWEDELSDPVKWLTFTQPEGEASYRLGDKFSVTGDLTDDAIIMAVASGTNKIVRWVVTDGVAGDAEVITLTGTENTQTSPAAVPFSTSPDANILVDGKGFAPTVFDKDGNVVGTIERIDNYAAYKIQSNSPNVFTYKGRTMAAFFQAMRQEPLGARIIVADITSQPYQIVDSSEYVSNSMAWDGYLGEVDVTVEGDYYYAYLLQAKNALGAYRGELLLPELVSAITTWEGDKVMGDFTKNIDPESVKGTTTNWTVTADGTALDIDTVYSENNVVTIEITTAIAEGQTVTLSYDGNGGIVAFDGMPLSTIELFAVENIVGADAPVASDVEISGTVQTGQTVTGTYTFSDADGDAEGESMYQWYIADDAEGTGMLKVIGGTDVTLTIKDEWKDKYLAFEVTPVSATGGEDYLVGAAVKSDFMLVKGVGVDETFANAVNMYPNPVNNTLTINNCNDVQIVKVIDYTGRTIMSVENTGNNELNVNMSELNAGVYIIQLTGENNATKVQRVVKN